jgi:hypothetical protein
LLLALPLLPRPMKAVLALSLEALLAPVPHLRPA